MDHMEVFSSVYILHLYSELEATDAQIYDARRFLLDKLYLVMELEGVPNLHLQGNNTQNNFLHVS